MKKFVKRSLAGFTLIELLIVVAIIAILAAIAVPNFLEAQTRAKVSRAKADMRSLATAIEPYQMDFNCYLYCNRPAFGIVVLEAPARPNHRPTFERLTSPVSYLASAAAFTDPFTPKALSAANWTGADSVYNATDAKRAKVYNYYARNTTAGGQARWDEAATPGAEPKPNWWFAVSAGPAGVHFHGDKLNENVGKDALSIAMYDSTNGTTSRGSIWRAGGTPPSKTDRDFYELIQGQY